MIVIYITAGLVGVYLVSIYNSLVKSKSRVDYSVGGIDAMLKKRFDLIPNLVATVKEYMAYEQDTHLKLVELRGGAKGNLVKVESESTRLLKSIMLNAESYPDLKANNSFIQLQQALNEVEEQLSAARRTYNANVFVYNNKCETIPSCFFARLMAYKQLDMFEIEVSEKKNHDVKELFKV